MANKTRPFYVVNNSSTNPLICVLPKETYSKAILINGYSIKGAPVTSSIPDDLFFSLVISNISNIQYPLRSDQKDGYCLQLKDTFTHTKLKEPEVVAKYSPSFLQELHFYLKTPSGADATYTSYVLELELVLENDDLYTAV